MEAGKEGIKFEAGPFSFYGMMALTASSGKNLTHTLGSNVTTGGQEGVWAEYKTHLTELPLPSPPGLSMLGTRQVF